MENWVEIFRNFLMQQGYNFIEDVDLKKLNTMRVGNRGKFYIKVETFDSLMNLMKFMGKVGIPHLFIGEGSNIIFEGNYEGVVIKLGKDFKFIKKEKDALKMGAGLKIASLMKFLIKNSIKGMEFLAGIPGTVGGALICNAGAFGVSMGDIILSISIMDYRGKLVTLDRNDVRFKYREVYIPVPGVVVEVTVKAMTGEKEEIVNKIKENIKYRLEKHPLGLSAGSIFKNPLPHKAGILIDRAGCKGLTIGGAYVSRKHANFILNRGDATGRDVIKLINKIKKIIQEKYSLMLEEEVRIIKEGI